MPVIDAPKFLSRSTRFVDFPCVVLIVGDEESLVSDCVAAVKKSFLSQSRTADQDFNLEILHGDRDDGARIIEACETLPAGAGRRLVIVHSLEKLSISSLKILESYSRSPNSASVLALAWSAKPNQATLSKDLPSDISREGWVIRCWKLYEDRAVSWVMEKAGEMGFKVSGDAASFLVRECGQSLNELKSEMEKLLLYVGDGKEVSLKDAQTIISFARSRSVWEMTDHLEQGKIKQAAVAMENCLAEGEDPVKLLSLIAWASRKRFSGSDPKNAEKIFSELRESDLRLKSGHGPESGNFERILRRIETLKN